MNYKSNKFPALSGVEIVMNNLNLEEVIEQNISKIKTCIKYNKTKQQLKYESNKLFWSLLNMEEIGKINGFI